MFSEDHLFQIQFIKRKLVSNEFLPLKSLIFNKLNNKITKILLRNEIQWLQRSNDEIKSVNIDNNKIKLILQSNINDDLSFLGQ